MKNKLFLNFNINQAIGLIHRVYLTQLKNSKLHLASTKTKSEVRGGGRKPWKQKGTGNARAGSIRSPLWRGGGVIFGPKYHLCSKKINKKEKRLAILYALYLKKKSFIFIPNHFETINTSLKTKDFLTLLTNYNISTTKKSLILFKNYNKSIYLATKNLKQIKLNLINCLNIKDLLQFKQIIMSQETFQEYLLNYIL